MLVRLQSLPHGWQSWRVLAVLGVLVLGFLFAGSAPAAASAQDAAVDQSPPVFGEFESILWSAVDASGAEVNYDPPRAYDDVDGEVGVECDYPTGSWFGLGDTLVTCYAYDSAGNSSGLEFYVSVVDTDAPVLDDREDHVAYTDADSAGTTVDYAPPLAYDNVDGEFEASCDPLPTSYFPVGENEIACYANDAAGNAAEPTYFFIIVRDDDEPTLYDRDDIDASAADGSGRAIEFSPPNAVDNVDGKFAASCNWASGEVFPLGQTEVICYASDNAGNNAEPVSFLVTISDDVPPTISGGSNVEVQADSADGEVVSFAVPAASDDVSKAVGVGCDPESGDFFPVGKTTVTCYATDDAGNDAAPVSFVVTVFAPPRPTEAPTKAPTEAPTKAPTEAPTKPATGTTEPEEPEAPEEPGTSTTPPATSPATAPATAPAGRIPTAEPTSAATSPAQPETPTTGTEEPAEESKTPAARPTAPALELPFPPPGFVPITGNGPLGSLTGIWGYKSFGISQEFGHTAFSISHSSWYAYGRNYGLDGRMHTGLDISMPAGTYLYSPVDGVVTVSGGTPYFTHYGNGQPGVGQLTITTAGGHQVILGHMARISVGVGERVQPGQFVGLSGGENGDHLHLEAREQQRGGGLVIVDPRQSFLTGLAGTFRLSGGPAALGAAAGNSVGGLVAKTIFESTDLRLKESMPKTPTPTPTEPTTSPTPPATSTPTPGTTPPPATASPSPPPVVVNPNPQPTNPPVVVRPNPRPSSPPVVVRPNPPTSTAGPVVVTNPTGSIGGTVGAPVTVVSPGVGSSASAPGTATTVVSTGGTGAGVATTTTVTTTEGGATTQTAVVTTGVQPGVVVGPAAIKANLPANRVKTPLVVTNPSLGEVNQPAQSTLGPVPSVLPGPTGATTGATTAPTVVTTEPQVATTEPGTVTTEGSVESTDQPAQTKPTVVVTEPTTAPTAPVVVVNAPAVVSEPNKATVGPAPVGVPAAVPAGLDDEDD